MALFIECATCGLELDEPGAVYLSPPDPDDPGCVSKLHLCRGCDERVAAAMHQVWVEAGSPL